MEGLMKQTMAKAGSRDHYSAKGVRAPRKSGEANKAAEAGSHSKGQAEHYDGRVGILC